MPKLPRISGKQLLAFLLKLGYRIVRQRGRHIRLEKMTAAGTHKLTVPNHAEIATGTLNDILGKVAVWNQISKERLIEMLQQ